MLLTIDDLVKVLRSSVNVQDPSGSEEIDPAYLSMTDDDIKLFIKVGVSRAYPDVEDLSELSDGSEYPIVLLAKIELYLKLAVLKADKVDMGADSAYLKQDQRFKHYMSLVEEAREEYDDWLENEGQGKIESYDVLLSTRHYTHRNYEKQSTPKVSVTVDEITTDTLKFHFGVKNSSHFGRFKVYLSESTIIDMHQEGAYYKDKILGEPTLLVSTGNIRNTNHEVLNLSPETDYHLAVIEVERNQVFGYKEITFTTLAELEVEEEYISENTK